MTGKRRVPAGLGLLAVGVGLLVGREARTREEIELVPHTSASRYERRYQNRALAAWRARVPGIKVIDIPSSVDGKKQRAIWYASGSDKKKPLLIALHSWSADYEQNLNIPFAEFAVENDWAFVHPDFRGPNLRPEATASDLAVSDVIDAVTYARKRAEIDADRIYLVGYSGGAMKALVLAGRFPELWAGVAAFSGHLRHRRVVPGQPGQEPALPPGDRRLLWRRPPPGHRGRDRPAASAAPCRCWTRPPARCPSSSRTA